MSLCLTDWPPKQFNWPTLKRDCSLGSVNRDILVFSPVPSRLWFWHGGLLSQLWKSKVTLNPESSSVYTILTRKTAFDQFAFTFVSDILLGDTVILRNCCSPKDYEMPHYEDATGYGRLDLNGAERTTSSSVITNCHNPNSVTGRGGGDGGAGIRQDQYSSVGYVASQSQDMVGHGRTTNSKRQYYGTGLLRFSN